MLVFGILFCFLVVDGDYDGEYGGCVRLEGCLWVIV